MTWIFPKAQGMAAALLIIVFSFVLTLLIIRITSPLATKLALVDIPCDRKNHASETPLTGGIAIYLTLVANLLLWHEMDAYVLSFLLASSLLVVFGALDDRKHLRVRYRVLVEIIAASVMIFVAGIWVGALGNLLGFGDIHMPFWAGYLFTLIAVFGIVNAANMFDGIDGLAGGVALSIFVVLLVFTSASQGLALFGLPIASALAAFLVANTGVTSRLPKVFLGDSGSKLLGLSIVWVIIETARTGSSSAETIQPVTALFLVALPLMDMVETTIGRLRRGVAPHKPDRSHLHHVLSDRGYAKPVVVGIILAASLALNLAGIAMTRLQFAEHIQFGLFVLVFLGLTLFKTKTIATLAATSKAQQPGKQVASP